MKNRIFIVLFLMNLAGGASAGEVDVEQWFNHMLQAEIDTVDKLHAANRLNMRKFPDLIARAVKEFGTLHDLGTKTSIAEAKTLLKNFLLFYNNFELQQRPELNQRYDEASYFPRRNVVLLFLEEAKSTKYLGAFVEKQKEIFDEIKIDIESQPMDDRKRIRKVADVVRNDRSQKRAHIILESPKAAPVSKAAPIKCTILAALILKGDISDAIVELALKSVKNFDACSVEGKLVSTPVLLIKAKRFALLRKTFGGAGNTPSDSFVKKMAVECVAGRLSPEDFQVAVGAERAVEYAQKRFDELLESVDAQDEAELEVWSLLIQFCASTQVANSSPASKVL